MSTPTPVTILGSTGLTGSETLHALLTSSHPFSITTATRHPPPHPFPLPQMRTPKRPNSPRRTNLAFALRYSRRYCPKKARTRGRSEKVDWELNRDLATRAKADGARTVSAITSSLAIAIKFHLRREIDDPQAILVSGSHASPDSSVFYLRIKGQLEEHLTTLGFDHVVNLKPGMLLGPRERVDWAEIGLQKLFGWARWAGVGTDALAVDGKEQV
ncbi:hypothetical protein L198_05860 [Cryptococcus wingfieldii CBS 7118]|uniref:NAD-dependent epimerase/dehydratase domain-containing protein n=1 Tax=Cryptococcus wingfieldii CBS 7118 TaxID=1295528 RepID=A0A1E3IRY8_9TREE|nr:hypothetical protein L198_05860 [Cryptococcus wingfieldii CBS 7118]ODN91349.1 hypothetical protein L198_05860 [Cryptococcus wingfieldii CBS 7118]